MADVPRALSRDRLGLEQAGLDARWWLLGVALSTTALGMLVPILSDAELLPTQLGSAILGVGMAGEFWPVVFISIFLTGAMAPGRRSCSCCCSAWLSSWRRSPS